MYDAESAVVTLENLAFLSKPIGGFNDGYGLGPTYGNFVQATFRIGFLGEETEFQIPVEFELEDKGQDSAASTARLHLRHIIQALAKALE
ncbi:MAG: hypothetical protein ACYDD1_05155 [Caulobacteraceae bacterium]